MVIQGDLARSTMALPNTLVGWVWVCILKSEIMNFAIAPQLNIIAHIFSDYMPLFSMCNRHRRRRRHLHCCVIVGVVARELHPQDDSNHYQKFIKMSVCLLYDSFSFDTDWFVSLSVWGFGSFILWPIVVSDFLFAFLFISVYIAEATVQLEPGTEYVSIGAAFNQGHSISIRSLCISSIFRRFFLIYTHLDALGALAHSVSFAIQHMGMARKVYSFRFILMTFWKSNQNFKSVTNLCRHTWNIEVLSQSWKVNKWTSKQTKYAKKQNRVDSRHFNYSKSLRIEALNVNNNEVKRKWNRDFLANVIDVNCHVVSEIEYEAETLCSCMFHSEHEQSLTCLK